MFINVNSAARLVSRTSMFCRISPFLVKLHWLPLKYRIIFKICLLMFKIINTPSPSYLTNLISAPKRANLRSSSNRIYLNPIKHTFAKRSFSFCGPYLWSRLPSSLSTLGSLTAFRRDLKTHLFRCFVAERLWAKEKALYKLIDWVTVVWPTSLTTAHCRGTGPSLSPPAGSQAYDQPHWLELLPPAISYCRDGRVWTIRSKRTNH